MAMIKCPECGKEMSDKATACPNCGCPIEDIRQSLEKFEAERNEAAKKKEDEKKAKEVAASIRKKKQEEARKAITPEMKRKRGVIAAGVTVAVVLIGILGWYFGVKIPKEKAYKAYVVAVDQANTAIGEYNDCINNYNTKAKEVININDELDTTLTTAQNLIDSGDEPFEGEKITTLSNTVKDARNNKVPTPSLKEIVPTVSIDETVVSRSKGDIETATQELSGVSEKYISSIPSTESEMTALTVPDYSEIMARIAEQTKELENSYAIQKQITAPEEDWVITRLGRVEDIASIVPVTEENDPNGHLNKDRGYTATVYFMSPLYRNGKPHRR